MRGYSLDPHPSIKVVVPANNVEIMDGLKMAMDKSDPKNHLYAAKVLGPSRSSEGVILYYILEMYNHG